MNKQIIKLTEDMGKVYVEISKLKAKKEVLKAKIWEAKGKRFPRKKIGKWKDLPTSKKHKKIRK